MYEILRENSKSETIVLDLGTGGCENVIKHYPNVKSIIATDYSPEMIKTAEANLIKSGRQDITLKVMDNLNMNVPKNYFDIVTARHTKIDAKQIYECLKPNGILIVRGVDKMDCWKLKRMFKRANREAKSISMIDYENILDAGFKDVELVPIHVREYYETAQGLYALLNKVLILNNFSEDESYSIDENIFNQYVTENMTDKGILLIRRYYGITAKK
jgi:SAM-dependent methyltransferase